MEIKILITLVLEILKTINWLNQNFMKNIFSIKTNAWVRPYDILTKAYQSSTSRDNNLAKLGPKIWNLLPQNIKADTPYLKFKEYLAT